MSEAAKDADASDAAPPAPTPDPAAIKEVASLKTADSLWEYIKKYSNLDDVQPDSSLTLQEQRAQAQALIGGKISHLQPALNAFLKDYPQDPRRYDAKLMRLLFLKDTDNITSKESGDVLHEVAAAKDAPPDARQQARAALLENDVQEADPSAGLTDALEKELSCLRGRLPRRRERRAVRHPAPALPGRSGSGQNQDAAGNPRQKPEPRHRQGRQGADRPAHGAAGAAVRGDERPGGRFRQAARQGRAAGLLGHLVRAVHDEAARGARPPQKI